MSTNQDHALALLRIYDSRPAGTINHTALGIINYLNGDDQELAQRLFERDGDKLPSYSKWGAEFEQYLYEHVGCRGHRVIDCKNWLCGAMAKDRTRHIMESV